MKVLVFDDRPDMLRYVKTALAMAKIPCEGFSTVDEADEAWETGLYDRLVVDLSIDPDGLGVDAQLTHNSLLTGWVWLIKRVYKDLEGDALESMLRRTVIFSGYIDNAREIIFNRDNGDTYWPEAFRKVKTVPKQRTADKTSLEQLVQALREIDREAR